jgi:hypothetical protein
VDLELQLLALSGIVSRRSFRGVRVELHTIEFKNSVHFATLVLTEGTMLQNTFWEWNDVNDLRLLETWHRNYHYIEML